MFNSGCPLNKCSFRPSSVHDCKAVRHAGDLVDACRNGDHGVALTTALVSELEVYEKDRKANGLLTGLSRDLVALSNIGRNQQAV